MQAAPGIFREFRMRYAIGLHAGGELVGVMTLNDDRVGHEILSCRRFRLAGNIGGATRIEPSNLKLLRA